MAENKNLLRDLINKGIISPPSSAKKAAGSAETFLKAGELPAEATTTNLNEFLTGLPDEQLSVIEERLTYPGADPERISKIKSAINQVRAAKQAQQEAPLSLPKPSTILPGEAASSAEAFERAARAQAEAEGKALGAEYTRGSIKDIVSSLARPAEAAPPTQAVSSGIEVSPTTGRLVVEKRPEPAIPTKVPRAKAQPFKPESPSGLEQAESGEFRAVDPNQEIIEEKVFDTENELEKQNKKLERLKAKKTSPEIKAEIKTLQKEIKANEKLLEKAKSQLEEVKKYTAVDIPTLEVGEPVKPARPVKGEPGVYEAKGPTSDTTKLSLESQAERKAAVEAMPQPRPPATSVSKPTTSAVEDVPMGEPAATPVPKKGEFKLTPVEGEIDFSKAASEAAPAAAKAAPEVAAEVAPKLAPEVATERASALLKDAPKVGWAKVTEPLKRLIPSLPPKAKAIVVGALGLAGAGVVGGALLSSDEEKKRYYALPDEFADENIPATTIPEYLRKAPSDSKAGGAGAADKQFAATEEYAPPPLPEKSESYEVDEDTRRHMMARIAGEDALVDELKSKGRRDLEDYIEASKDRSQQRLIAQMGLAGEAIRTGLGGVVSGGVVTKGLPTDVYQTILKSAEEPIEDYKVRRQLAQESALKDPSSPESRQMREMVGKALNISLPSTASGEFIKQFIPQIAAYRIKEKQFEETAKLYGLKEKAKSESDVKKDTERKNKFVQSLRKEMTTGGMAKLYTNFNMARKVERAISEFSKNPSGFTDFGTIMTGLKALQGDDSVLRSSEMQLGMNATDFRSRMKNYIDKFATGKQLQPEQRMEIARAVRILARATKEQYKEATAPALRQAESMGIDADLLVQQGLIEKIEKKRVTKDEFNNYLMSQSKAKGREISPEEAIQALKDKNIELEIAD